MKKIASILWREPVVILSATTGSAVALSAEGVIPGWGALLVFAVVTPIQRALVKPKHGRTHS